MTTRVVYPEFRDEHADSRYPFADDTTLVATSGQVLANAIVMDALLFPIGNGGPVWLSRIEIERLTITWVFGNSAGDVCRGVVDLGAVDASVELRDSLLRPAGVLLVNPALVFSLQSWDAGRHEFGEGAGDLVASCVAVAPEVGVRGVAAGAEAPVSGDVWLIGEDGVQFAIVPGGIRVDVVGDPLFRRRVCGAGETFVVPEFLRTINGISPSYWGGFQIQAGRVLASRPALRVYVDESGAVVIGLAARSN